MKRYIVYMHVGYVGMDAYDTLVMPDDATDDEVQLEAWYMAADHAQSYGYYPPDYTSDDEEDEDTDHISTNIEGWAELYDPKKHDNKRPGGGSFEADFIRLENIAKVL